MEQKIQTQISLQKLSIADGPLVYRLLQRIPRLENGFFNSAYGLSYEEFKDWLIRQEEISKGISLEQDMVAYTTYWLVVDHIPIGYGKVRHELTEVLRKTGGNIAYSIEPRRRGNGYGKQLLYHLLLEAKKLGQTEAVVVAYSYNNRSIAVAKANGGKNYQIAKAKHYFQFLF